MRIGWRLERSKRIKSVTKGRGTNEESMNAAKSKPIPPQAGKLAVNHDLSCAQPTTPPTHHRVVDARTAGPPFRSFARLRNSGLNSLIINVTVSRSICAPHTLSTFPGFRLPATGYYVEIAAAAAAPRSPGMLGKGKRRKIHFRRRGQESLLTTDKRVANRNADEESHQSMVPDRVTSGPSCTYGLDAFRV